MPAVAPASGHHRPPGPDKKLKPIQPTDDDDQKTTTDESSDEATALEMDSQELWTQIYCATCDCLIEPGEGLTSKVEVTSKGEDATSSGQATAHTSLKSRSGTIKARQDKEQLPEKPGKETAPTNNAANLKRTHSAGRLYARGVNGPFGPHKRTGSAGSRLNALSELRPTTKLHPTADDKGKSKASAFERGKGQGRKNPALSRRGLSASVKSSTHSGPSSLKSTEANVGPPSTSNSTTNNNSSSSTLNNKNRPRSMLGDWTPAALKQQQAEQAQKKAPAQLYCSERCRTIDERRSAGLGELSQYLSQPLVSQAPPAWSNNGWVAGQPMTGWTRSTSMSSMSLPFAVGTPESECMCPECMDKYAEAGSAGGATVPSGASDTTESSSGYIYGRPSAGPKRRTASGRIVTPLNLHPPGAGTDSYFPSVTGNNGKRGSTSSPRLRSVEGVSFRADGKVVGPPPRTSSAGPVGSVGTNGTDTSTVSSTGAASLWEPKVKRSSAAVTTLRSVPVEARRVRESSDQTERNGQDGRQRSSTTSSMTKNASGRTTVTATPAISSRHLVMQTGTASSLGQQAGSRRIRPLSVPVFTPVGEHEKYTGPSSSRAMPGTAKASVNLVTSPLNLLSRSSHNYAAPSIDVWSEHVGSPSARGSFLSRSLASENTLMGGTSGITLSGANSKAHPNRGHERSSSSSATIPGAEPVIGLDISEGMGRSSSRDADGQVQDPDQAEGLSLAVGSLKLAQSRADQRFSTMGAADDNKRTHNRRLSLFGTAMAPMERRYSTARSVSSSGSGSNSGWLRSLSSAWNTFRGAPPEVLSQSDDLESNAAVADEEIGGESHPTGSLQNRRPSMASRGSDPYRALAPWSRRSDVLSSPPSPTRSNFSQSPAHRGLEHQEFPTPTQSLVAKPTIRRGTVPAFAREIGQGEIPGEAIEGFEGQPSSIRSNSAQAGVNGDSRSCSDNTSGAMDTSEEEIQRRRRQERKEANRQRRSRDIHMLPPLLAPISRQGSSTNLYNHMPLNARGSSHGRPRTQSNTPQMSVGNAGSASQGYMPQRPTTPRLAAYGNGPPSPSLMRSPYHATFQQSADGRGMVSPNRPGSATGFHGTSPRAKGLGWGAMTSITSAGPPMQGPNAGSSTHLHSTSISYGHAAALANRSVHAQANGHLHHGHGHNYGHRHQHAHVTHAHGHVARPGSTSRHSAGGSTGIQLGNLGLLGAHPHGHATIPGRHSTMPVVMQRSPTPSVPEDGGEMTSGDFVPRPSSAMARQVSSHMPPPPPRSRSSVGMHNMAEQGDRTWSYEALPGLRQYPVLQPADKREMHDIYDPGWGLGDGGLAKHLTGRPQSQSQNNGFEQQQQHRKKLFYFDA